MYFVYQKQINVASEYSYDVDSIVEWFKDYIDLNDIIEAYGGEVTAKDVVDDIFSESDSWYDNFIQHFDIEPDVVENMYSEDIAEQIREVTEDKFYKGKDEDALNYLDNEFKYYRNKGVNFDNVPQNPFK